jgi:hypothetical protein
LIVLAQKITNKEQLPLKITQLLQLHFLSPLFLNLHLFFNWIETTTSPRMTR